LRRPDREPGCASRHHSEQRHEAPGDHLPAIGSRARGSHVIAQLRRQFVRILHGLCEADAAQEVGAASRLGVLEKAVGDVGLNAEEYGAVCGDLAGLLPGVDNPPVDEADDIRLALAPGAAAASGTARMASAAAPSASRTETTRERISALSFACLDSSRRLSAVSPASLTTPLSPPTLS